MQFAVIVVLTIISTTEYSRQFGRNDKEKHCYKNCWHRFTDIAGKQNCSFVHSHFEMI